MLGIDFAGVVEAVGEGVTRFAAGDEILGLTFSTGTIAEYTLVDDGPQVCHRPASLSAERGAAVPTPLMTAAGLASAVEMHSGQTLFLIGAGGAVGSFFLQLVAPAEFQVLGTAKPSAADRLGRLGVKDLIYYKTIDANQEALRLVPGGVDLAIDLVNSGDRLTSTVTAIRDEGRLLSTLDGKPMFERGVTATYVEVDDGFDQFDELVMRVTQGDLHLTTQAHQFADSVEVFTAFAAHRTEGWVVILI